jgi:hypothetical protein
MATTKEVIETTAGEFWIKKADATGRTYYVHKGEGKVSWESYRSAKGHRKPYTEQKKQGNDVAIATPDGEKYVSKSIMTHIGKMLNYKSGNSYDENVTVDIDGVTYTAKELAQANQEASKKQPHIGGVRYI